MIRWKTLLQVLLVVGIVVMGGLFWARAHPKGPSEAVDPLGAARFQLATKLGLETGPLEPKGGVRVTGIKPGSFCAHSGLKPGDRIVAFLDQSIWHAHQLRDFIVSAMENNQPVPLLVENNGSYRRVVLGVPMHRPGQTTGTNTPAPEKSPF